MPAIIAAEATNDVYDITDLGDETLGMVPCGKCRVCER